MSLTNSNRLVIKVGSALTAPGNNGCSSKYLKNIADFIQTCRRQGKEVILVSSGSVAAGRQWFANDDSCVSAYRLLFLDDNMQAIICR